MASLLLAKCYSPRPRAISNGGLGGFIDHGHEQFDMDRSSFDGKGTWPKRRRRAPPPPLKIDNNSDKIFVSQTTVPPSLIADCRDPRTPRTPRTADVTNVVTKESLGSLASPFMSRYNNLPVSVYCSLPPTPTPVEKPILSPPLELPGSLLLPSQGFPQSNPPRTPSRHLDLRRSASDQSQQSITPELSVSSSTDTEDGEMLKHFSTTKRRGPRPEASGLSTSSSSQRSVGKSISAMTADELLQVLPSCDKATVTDDWIPAMVREHKMMMKLLNDAANINLDAHQDLKHFGEDLQVISEDARKISTTYEKALDSAESLLERDTRHCLAKLEAVENHLDEALTTIEVNNQNIGQKDKIIKGLQQAREDIVCTLGAFIRDNMDLSSQDVESPRVKNIMQIIADHSSPSDREGQMQDRYLRVPESSHLDMLAELREVQSKAQKYRELAISQNQMIQNQSAQLDDAIARYEKCVRAVKEGEHEALLLRQQNKDCLITIKGYETGATVSPSTRAVQDQLYQRQEDLEQALQRMSDDHSRQLERRDAEIYHLRSRLGSAEGEAMARRADVKNVITHTQALLSPVEPAGNMLPGYTSKERKKPSLAKPKTITLSSPNERSTRRPRSSTSPGRTGSRTGTPSINGEEAPQRSIEHDRFNAKPQSRLLPRHERPAWGCGISPPNLGGLSHAEESTVSLAPRMRYDSLPAANEGSDRRPGDARLATAVTRRLLGSPLLPEKELPNAPPSQHAFNVSSSNNDEDLDRFPIPSDDPSQPTVPRVPDDDQLPQTLARKRVLSRIPEASIEDADEERDTLSTTSSDKDVFRRGMSLIDFLKESDVRTSSHTQQQHQESPSDGSIADIDDAVIEDIAQVHDLRGAFRAGPWATTNLHKGHSDDTTTSGSEGDSPPMSVRAMYHAQQARMRR